MVGIFEFYGGDDQPFGAEHDNDPGVRDARAGPWNRFATRRGGAGQYTED